MYTNGIKKGDNSYIISEDDGNLKLISGSNRLEEMEEYIKLDNQYEEKKEEKNHISKELSQLYKFNKESKRRNIEILLTTIVIEGLLILLGALATQTESLVIFPAITIGIGVSIKISKYGTKKKRTKTRIILNSRIEKVDEELKEIRTKMNTLKEKMDYSEIDLYENEIVPVTTAENKKAHVKMRVLKLEQNR